MDENSESAELQQRLKSLLHQVHLEFGILDRIVYKNKNQHRRCPYFQYLLKVRRDAKLFQSSGLEDVLSVLFPIIQGEKPAQSAFFRNRVKKKNPSGKYNYQERLLGVARLLSQMIEPILKAAIQISFLLAKSFFVGFSVVILALLARLRVLLQQVLLDVVVVFNKVSLLSQKKHSVKLSQDGIEAFREFYPSNADSLMLECSWKGDKFVLLEKKMDHNTIEDQDANPVLLPVDRPIQYEILELFNEVPSMEHSLSLEKVNEKSSTKDPLPCDERCAPDQVDDAFGHCANDIEHEPGKDLLPTSVDSAARGNVIGLTGASTSSMQAPSESRKVAFVSVRKSAPLGTDNSGPNKKVRLEMQAESVTKQEDPFLTLLMAGNTKGSIF